MPELIEAEMYRRSIDQLIGHRLVAVELRDSAYLRPAGAPAGDLAALCGSTLAATQRHGKLVLLELASTDGVRHIGLHFGMTGRITVDGRGPIDALVYSSSRGDEAWNRVILQFGDHLVAMNDPRRLGFVHLDPDETALGPDAATITVDELTAALDGRTAAIKSILLNQKLVAGLGNLLVDEVLWRTGIRPDRPVGELTVGEIERLAATIVSTVEDLTDRGGSHTGDTFDHRLPGGRCPKDGATMTRLTVGGRSSWFCPDHQR